MAGFWMVRAGEGGYLFREFERTGRIGVGWEHAGDFSDIHSLDEMKQRLEKTGDPMHPSALSNSAGMAWKFRGVMQKGDTVVTYDPSSRQYLLGTVVGDYEFAKGKLPDFDHTRRVEWSSRVPRMSLRPSSRNTLGSVLTIFEPGDDVLEDLRRCAGRLEAVDQGAISPEIEEREFDVIRRDTLVRAHEFIKDRILALDEDEMELLVAAVLRAMGFKARVTPKGPDRGRDVLASPDGLGLVQPRIFAEVKHRKGSAMGAPEIRGFAGGLREGDRGVYVSIGGFTREARYEADRSSIPVALVDLDDIARLVVEHYEGFDAEGRRLVPLVKVYWPISD